MPLALLEESRFDERMRTSALLGGGLGEVPHLRRIPRRRIPVGRPHRRFDGGPDDGGLLGIVHRAGLLPTDGSRFHSLCDHRVLPAARSALRSRRAAALPAGPISPASPRGLHLHVPRHQVLDVARGTAGATRPTSLSSTSSSGTSPGRSSTNAGEIYEYVGDEVVLTWKEERGIKDANCIRVFFDIDSVIEKKTQRYLDQFGVVPEYKAGVHVGEVMTAEIGDLKRGLVFNGDVLNTGARIQGRVCAARKAPPLLRRPLGTPDCSARLVGRGDGLRDAAWEVRAVGVGGVRVTAEDSCWTPSRDLELDQGLVRKDGRVSGSQA